MSEKNDLPTALTALQVEMDAELKSLWDNSDRIRVMLKDARAGISKIQDPFAKSMLSQQNRIMTEILDLLCDAPEVRAQKEAAKKAPSDP
jgi:hypothetical protein